MTKQQKEKRIHSLKAEMSTFQFEIEFIMKEKQLTLMEAIIDYSTKNSMEVEIVAKLLNPTLKARLKNEAAELHFLRYKNGKVIRPTNGQQNSSREIN